MKLFSLILLSAVFTVANAQTHSSTLTWVNGSGNPASTASNVYKITGVCPSTPSWGTALTTGLSAVTYTDLAVVATTTYCYAVTNVVNGVESAKSATVQVTIPPSVPTGLSVVAQ